MGTQNPVGGEPGPEAIETLIEAARSGNADALGRLTEHYRWFLLQAANGEVPDDLRAKVSPSDLVQETFLDVHQGFARFRGTTGPELYAWMQQILRNNVLEAARKYRGTEKRDLGREESLTTVWTAPDRERQLPTTDETPSKQVLANERAVLTAAAFERLPEHYREVITMRNVDRRSFVEIGDLMQRSSAAARQLWLRAVDQLRQELGGTYDSH